MTDDNAAIARAIIDANSYMVLGTADASGSPWVSPVWFATEAYREFFWVSSPEARHSRNLAVRPQLSIVIFDSTVIPGEGAAVYMSATAEELTGDAIEAGLEVYAQSAGPRQPACACGRARVDSRAGPPPHLPRGASEPSSSATATSGCRSLEPSSWR